MRFLRLTIAYDGTEFSGWQWQTGRRTVQGVLEAAIQQVTGESLRVVASGRTDAGVHALGQAVSFSTQSRLDEETLGRALNANLPRDVSVVAVAEAPEGFNAIEDSRAKRYRYVIDDGPLQDLFTRRYAWHVRKPLDYVAMSQAAKPLVGEHDFKSYESAGSRRLSTVRRILEFDVQRRPYQDGERIVIEVEGNGFLYNMVRNLVGTLVEVGHDKQPVTWPHELLAQRDRRLAGMTAPPQGLYLLRVTFDEACRAKHAD